ncbi:MAG TPA: DUF5985 family protein [Longimicrobium sp.]|nr:DUF5985 family protein [Longimicrobium sp.]
MTDFVSGALALGYLVSGLFFLRFWKETRDRLFGIFATAFFLLAFQRSMLTLAADPREEAILLYAVRLLAFLLILYAIVDKNRGGR